MHGISAYCAFSTCSKYGTAPRMKGYSTRWLRTLPAVKTRLASHTILYTLSEPGRRTSPAVKTHLAFPAGRTAFYYTAGHHYPSLVQFLLVSFLQVFVKWARWHPIDELYDVFVTAVGAFFCHAFYHTIQVIILLQKIPSHLHPMRLRLTVVETITHTTLCKEKMINV